MFEKLRAILEQLPVLLQQVALSMQNLGTGAYLIVSLVVLGETIVGLGLLLPGTLFIVFIGFLCYLQIYDFGGMLVSVLVAHYLGEAANYMLGWTKGRALFRPESKVFRPSLLEAA